MSAYPHIRASADERPERPRECRCGSTSFTWIAGFRGSYWEPAEPCGWMCNYCESTDFDDDGEQQ